MADLDIIKAALSQGNLGFASPNTRQVKGPGIFRLPTGIRTAPDVTNPDGSITAGADIAGTEFGGGINVGNVGTAVGGLGSIFEVLQGFKQNRLAQEQLNLSRDVYNTNKTANTKSYNRQVEDQLRARASRGAGGFSNPAEVRAAIEKAKL